MKKLYVLLVVSVLTGTLFYGYQWGSKANEPKRVNTVVAAAPPQPVLVSHEIIVGAIEKKWELATVSLKEADTPHNDACEGYVVWNYLFGGTCASLEIHAHVRAGFDKNFARAHVVDTPERVTVDLGEPTILGVQLDNDHFGVTENSKGTFRFFDKDVLPAVFADSLGRMRATACSEGILMRAVESAEEQYGEELRARLRMHGDTRLVEFHHALPVCV